MMARLFNLLWYRMPRYSAYVLLPFSGIYAIFFWIARSLRWCYQVRLSRPVVIVGNLTVGGTGKTPLVIALAEALKERGYMPGIISRGYKSKCKQLVRAVDADSDPAEVGDEPVLIKRRTACPVVISRCRLQAAKYLLANENIDVIISDDGLQNHSIPHDIEIAVIDGQRRFGNGLLLPAGPLRESLKRLQKVDFRITNGNALNDEIPMLLQATALVNCADRTQIAVEKLPERIHACAGIGNPESFFTLLREKGISIYEHVFPDHYLFQPRDLDFGDDLDIVMTEKDAVKCQAFASNKMWYLPINAFVDQRFYQMFFKKLNLILNQYGRKTAE